MLTPGYSPFTEEVARLSSFVALPVAAVGFLGNALLMRLMLNKDLKHLSCSVFLFVLALSDSVVLLYEIVDDIAVHIPWLTAYDILFGYSKWRCRVGMFFYETSKTVSAWLVVALSAELCLAATRPKRRAAVYNRRRAVYITLAVVLISVAGGFPFLVLTEAQTMTMEQRCMSLYPAFLFVYDTFVLQGATHCLFPLLFIIICNCRAFAIILKEKNTQQYAQNSINGIPSKDSLQRRGVESGGPPCQSTGVILAISVVYLLTITPGTVVQVALLAQRFMGDFWGSAASWLTALYITNCLYLVNFACKFYGVLLASAELRSTLSGKRTIDPNSDAPFSNGAVSSSNGTVMNGSINGFSGMHEAPVPHNYSQFF